MSPEALVSRYLKRSLKTDAQVAAVILRACPEFIGGEEIGSWLRRIGAGTIRKEAVAGFLERAGVNPWRAGCDLKVHQRHALAAELDRFAEGLDRR